MTPTDIDTLVVIIFTWAGSLASHGRWQVFASWTVAGIRLMDGDGYSFHGPWQVFASCTVASIRLMDCGKYSPHGRWRVFDSWTVAGIRLMDSGKYPPHGRIRFYRRDNTIYNQVPTFPTCSKVFGFIFNTA